MPTPAGSPPHLSLAKSRETIAGLVPFLDAAARRHPTAVNVRLLLKAQHLRAWLASLDAD